MPGEPLSSSLLNFSKCKCFFFFFFFRDLRLSKTSDLFSELLFYAGFGQDAVIEI